MHSKELEGLENFTTVISPAGLRAELDSLLEKASHDAAFAAESHYVKFQLGGLQSFIRIDMSDKPFLFWYCDLDERAVSPAVRNVIADFLWEKGGEKEKYLDATNLEEIRQNFRSEGVKVFIPNINIPDIHKKALQTIAEIQGDLTPDQEKISKLKNETRSETLQRIAEQSRQKSAPVAVFQDPIPSVDGFGLFSKLFHKAGKSDTPKSTPGLKK